MTKMTRFLTDAEAAARVDSDGPKLVKCGGCFAKVPAHSPQCPYCQHKFYPNMHGYARICKNPSCSLTESAGHAHGLCLKHHRQRKERQANTAQQLSCRCGNKASFNEITCSRCRAEEERREEDLRLEESVERCPHGVKMIFGNVCCECQGDYVEMRRDDQRNYENRG